MSVKVKFFASLKDQIGIDECDLEYQSDMNASSVWQQLAKDQKPPANLLVAINLEYCDLQSAVKDNDEVAFFPPVTGG